MFVCFNDRTKMHPQVSNQASLDRTAGAFRGEFSYKNRCSSLCNLNFDRIVKQLSDFEGKS